MRLVGVGEPSHATHDTENVVVSGIDTNLGSLDTLNSSVGENKLKSSVVNAREVARAAWLVLLGAQGKGVHVDAGVGGGSVVLVGLHGVEVGAFTLREAVLAVKLELSGDNGVVAPAVEGEGSLGEDEGAGIRNTRLNHVAGSECFTIGTIGGETSIASKVDSRVPVLCTKGLSSGGIDGALPPAWASNIDGTSIIEHVVVNEGAGGESSGILSTEGMDGVGKSIHGVGVVEGLGTEKAVEELVALEGRAVVDVAVGLDNPDELLNRVVEVELDLVGRGTDGLITSELELLNQVLVGVLGHAPALISVQEHVVDIKRGSNEGLVVCSDNLTTSSSVVAVQGTNSPQALINGADIKVNLDLVVLKGDEGKGKTGVAAIPELEGNIEGGLRESIAGSANLARGSGLARTVYVIKRGVSDVSQLSGVSNHGKVARALVNRQSQLVPDVHPITVLAINALATDLDLNLRNNLLTGEVKPTGINTVLRSALHLLVNLRESNLKVSAVSQITIAGDSAGHTATKIGLTVESLLNRLHSKVGIALVAHLPEGNLRITSQINVLSAIGDKLHQSTSHFVVVGYTMPKEKKFRKTNELNLNCMV